MTCLTIVQSVCRRMGLTVPTTVFGGNDSTHRQIAELASEAGKDMARRYQWQALNKEVSFTTLATENQGALSVIADGMDYIINDTIWNRSLRRPVFGPKVPQTWQQQKAFAINGPWSSFRIQEGSLMMYPVPETGQTCYFEYITKNWVVSDSGAAEFTKDTDTSLLDEEALKLDTLWRFKSQKGLEYAEDFNKAERMIQDLKGRDASKDWLNLSNTKYDIFPGVIVPAGSWNVNG